MPSYQRRPSPEGAYKGFLDKELQSVQRAIHGVVSRTVTADTAIKASDYLILCDPTSAAIAVSFPVASKAKDVEVTVKQINSNANAVTLGGTFDGSLNPTLGAENNALTVQSDGTAWYITGKVT